MREVFRQFFHFFLSVLAIAIVLSFGVELSAYLVACALVFGLVLVHLKLRGMHLGPLERVLDRVERPGVVKGYGALTFTAAVLAILTLLSNQGQIIASLIILGFGDSASTFFGLNGKRRLPYNARKTYEGSLAFFFFSLPAVYFAGWPALLVAAAAALAESFESRMDDNLIISIVCVVLFRLVG
jgi:dolichol kinase